MINCYKDPKDKDGVIVELEGDCIDITSDFVCKIGRASCRERV